MKIEKECFCIKNHKNKIANEEIKFSEKFEYIEEYIIHLNIHCFYIFKEDWKYDLLYCKTKFSQYFTTDIRKLRKQKLEKIKKSSSI